MMIKTSNKICKSCKYSCTMASYDNGKGMMCNYLAKTGKRRNCEIGECDKYEPKRRRKNENSVAK